MFARWVCAIGIGVGCMATVAAGGEWPQFRGPGNAGVSGEAKLPEEWGADKNVAWKVKVPGYGWSSPIVWGNRGFITTAISDKQQKPSGGFGGGPGGGGPRGGRPGGGGPGGGRGGFGRGQKPPD